jgi:hypothetical protein
MKKENAQRFAEQNSLEFLNKLTDYSAQVKNLGIRGNRNIKIPYGNIMDDTIELWEVLNCLLILKWNLDDIKVRDEDESNLYILITV